MYISLSGARAHFLSTFAIANDYYILCYLNDKKRRSMYVLRSHFKEELRFGSNVHERQTLDLKKFICRQSVCQTRTHTLQ